MKKVKKSLAVIVLGTTLFTSNVYAGVPVVDSASITQNLQNFVQTMAQNIKEYGLKAKEYALQAKQFIQEETKGINDMIGKANEGLRWIQEQKRALTNALQETAVNITDPITGIVKEMPITEFTKLLRSADNTYTDLLRSLMSAENSYATVTEAFKNLEANPNLETVKKFKDVFGNINTQTYINDCTYQGQELKSCALKWGNRIAFIEGVTQIESNIKAISNYSQHGLTEIASKSVEEDVKVVSESGTSLGILQPTTTKLSGTTEKQQLEANNIIADAQVAMQEQVAKMQQLENEYKKRDEMYREYAQRELERAASASAARIQTSIIEETTKELDVYIDIK